MGNFCNACADVQEGPRILNMDSTNVNHHDKTSTTPKRSNIKYAAIDLNSSASDTDSEEEGLSKKKNKKTKPIKYDYEKQNNTGTHTTGMHEGIDIEKEALLKKAPLSETSIQNRHSDTTITTINTISTMHSIQTLNSNHTGTTMTYSRSEKIVHKINQKHTFMGSLSSDATSLQDHKSSDHDSDHEARDYYDENVMTPSTFKKSNNVPDPDCISISRSLPTAEHKINIQKKPFSQFMSDDTYIHGQHGLSLDNIGYKFTFLPDETPMVENTTSFDNFLNYSTTPKKTLSLKNVNSGPNPATFGLYNPYQSTTKPAEIAAIFFQLTSLKKLDNASQINVILDEFLTDYNLYASQLNIPYKYLFKNDIIGNLIFAWNLGVKKINSTLITYSIQSLCKFTQRDEFRAPFLAQHGINLIDKTLSIPSLQSPKQSSKNKHPLAAITSANSVDFASNSLSHILAVLKITRDICRLDVIDTMLWCSTKIHQKVLSTMKRDYDEVRITRACRDTLIALLDAAYEIGEEIMNNNHIHDMIDSFLISTKNEYLSNRTTTSYSSQHSLPHIDESLPPVKSGSNSLLHPLFEYSSLNSDDMEQLGGAKKSVKHQKRKNLYELQEEKKEKLKLKLTENSSDSYVQDIDLLRQISCITHVSEVSECDTYDESSNASNSSLEEKVDDDIELPQPQPRLLTISHEMDTENNEHVRSGTMIRIPSTKSGISIISDRDTDEQDTIGTSSIHTQLIHGLSEADSILSLRDYDAMVEEQKARMSDIDEVENDNTQFEQHPDYNDEEKSHTVPSMQASMIDIHSVNIDDDGVVIDIELQYYQLLYINSLFHILYKIITLEKMKETSIAISRPTSVRNSGQTFMGLLNSRKKRDKSRGISGGTAGGLCNMDAVYMSDSEMLMKGRNSNKLKKINHKKNKLLEAFFASLSFKNLFKLLKCYQLSGYNEVEDVDYDMNNFVNKTYVVKKINNDSDSDNSDVDRRMVSVEILACKILRKILSYSQIITDTLLLSGELDVIGILVGLLFQHQSNIDLIIYILDIFCKITKDNEDIRELLLSPDYFDKFLRSLDAWWIIFIKSSQRLVDGVDSNGNLNAKNKIIQGIEKVSSTESIGVMGKLNEMTRSKSMVNAELHIDIVIAMLKFFQILSDTNALDMVEYGINDRILVLLDYYLNVSLKYDNDDNDDGGDDNLDDLFIFNDKQHQECLTLCIECISNLATDINMLLEFVCSGTVEKLSTICWSFRDHSVMIKKCCNVINKLLKLQQSCQEIVNGKQNVLKPLICCTKYLFKKSFVDNNDGMQLIIAYEIFPNNNNDSNNDIFTDYETDDDDEDEYEYETDDDDEEYSDSEQTDSEEEIFAKNKKAVFERKVRFEIGNKNNSISKSCSMNTYSQNMSRGIHANLRDLKDLFSVFINMSCIDELCVKMIESDLMLLLIELLSNRMLLIHSHMMMSLVISDLLQHLTKNKKGAKLLIESNQFEITKHICNAIENNINNRGVVMKYLRALQNLKNANAQILKQQLSRNKCIGFLNNVDVHYQTVFNQMIHQILKDDSQNAEDDEEEEEEESEEEESNSHHDQKQ